MPTISSATSSTWTAACSRRFAPGVKPGGLFVGILHRFDGTPGRYLLESGELREEFAGWKILYYSERPAEDGHRRATAAIVARRA